MKETLETINRIQADGVIKKYAIGGTVGATLYLEPAATLNIDVFVTLPGFSEGSLVGLSSIYQYLAERGCKSEGEHIVIGQWPVRFLIPSNALEHEALFAAIPADAGIPTWVMAAEYLVAIALQAGRAGDHTRVLQFLDHKAVDRATLDRILTRHELFEEWRKFQIRYSDDRDNLTINERRRKLAALSFGEKLELLEKLRERSLAFAEARKKLTEKKKPQ